MAPESDVHRPREPRLTHVALPCSDLDRTLAFYTALTPLVVVTRHEDDAGRSAWLSNEAQVTDPFVLVLAEVAGEALPTLQPFAHLGIEVPERADVDRVAARAAELGHPVHWEPRQMAPHIGYICALRDPDGNVVEFSHGQQVFSTVRERWAEQWTQRDAT